MSTNRSLGKCPHLLALPSEDSPLHPIPIPFDGPASRATLSKFVIEEPALANRLDRLVDEFVQAVRSFRPPGLICWGTAREADQVPGCNRTVRILCKLPPRDQIALDVTFQSRADGLGVRCRLLSRMVIARARILLYLSAFLALWGGLFLGLLGFTDMEYKLGQHFAEKYFANPEAGLAVLVYGWDVDATPRIGSPYQHVEPWEIFDYVYADPVLFLKAMAPVSSILGAVAAGIALLIPRWFHRFPCWLLKWPAPGALSTARAAHREWFEQLIFQKLAPEHGVTNPDLIDDNPRVARGPRARTVARKFLFPWPVTWFLVFPLTGITLYGALEKIASLEGQRLDSQVPPPVLTNAFNSLYVQLNRLDADAAQALKALAVEKPKTAAEALRAMRRPGGPYSSLEKLIANPRRVNARTRLFLQNYSNDVGNLYLEYGRTTLRNSRLRRLFGGED